MICPRFHFLKMIHEFLTDGLAVVFFSNIIDSLSEIFSVIG